GAPPDKLGTAQNPSATAFMEWSNALMRLWSKQGELVQCDFTLEEALKDAPIPEHGKTLSVQLRLRKVFTAPAHNTSAPSVSINPELLKPGELTQGLCSPWQNDYRECACYYWAASRPDYVNVQPGPDGRSQGDNWLQKQRTGNYVADNRHDSRLF